MKPFTPADRSPLFWGVVAWICVLIGVWVVLR